MVIYLDIGFNSPRKKIFFSLYFPIVCLQLGLPNSSWAPARLSTKSLDAGAENAGVVSAGSLEEIAAVQLMGRHGKLPPCTQDPVCLHTGCCFSPIPVEGAHPVLSLVRTAPRGSSPGRAAVDSHAVPATQLRAAQLATCTMEQRSALAPAAAERL